MEGGPMTHTAIEQGLLEIRAIMLGRGYRPAVLEDVIAGKEAVMIETGVYFQSARSLPQIGTESMTLVRLDDNPTQDNRLYEGGKVVYFHHLCPRRDELAFVGINEFVCDGDENSSSCDIRFFVKIDV
ncbi:MAG: hypothetical protein ABL917_01230 [Parcubacteria group bacterium]